jgi:hypothetical protein
VINERIDILRVAGGDLVQLRFDLADAELLAIARSLATVIESLLDGLRDLHARGREAAWR